ncbi:MAG: ferrous iron transport protein A [Thermoprotei archaeon]|nr:MAG: ferrous iron transport protein A [Thermoprotei archaeon]
MNKVYEIVRVEGRGFVKRRMLDMGLTPGVKVKIVRVAPLGDPLDIVVRGYNLSIRKNEASLVIVREVTR